MSMPPGTRKLHPRDLFLDSPNLFSSCSGVGCRCGPYFICAAIPEWQCILCAASDPNLVRIEFLVVIVAFTGIKCDQFPVLSDVLLISVHGCVFPALPSFPQIVRMPPVPIDESMLSSTGRISRCISNLPAR